MSNTPRLSVIVASYNSRRTIANCLQSLRRQVTDQAFEVLVVDSSNDGTGDLVAERFPEVGLLRFQERKYPGDARNAGIEAARAEIVASVDADCEAREDWVERILEAHRHSDGEPVLQEVGHPEVWALYRRGLRLRHRLQLETGA